MNFQEVDSCVGGPERKHANRQCTLFVLWKFFSNRVVNTWNRLHGDLAIIRTVVPVKQVLNQNRDVARSEVNPKRQDIWAFVYSFHIAGSNCKRLHKACYKAHASNEEGTSCTGLNYQGRIKQTVSILRLCTKNSDTETPLVEQTEKKVGTTENVSFLLETFKSILRLLDEVNVNQVPANLPDPEILEICGTREQVVIESNTLNAFRVAAPDEIGPETAWLLAELLAVFVKQNYNSWVAATK